MPKPIAEGLFTWPSDRPQLIGSRCVDCGATTFPQQQSCPRCAGASMEARPLPRRGTLWTFTVQGFRPKEPYRGPAEFEPFGVGYVDLGGEVMVESPLTESDPAHLPIGGEMELVIVPHGTDDQGEEIVTFAFRPLVDSPAGAGR